MFFGGRVVKNAVCMLLFAGATVIVSVPSMHAQQRLNWYRTLYTSYDSVELGCTYGEMCVPSTHDEGDTLFLPWVNCRTAALDTTCDFINRITQSVPFAIDGRSTLRMFRMISYTLRDDNAAVFTLPDTTAWTVELWNWNTHRKIATLDSVGICKAVDHPRLQALEGFGPGWKQPFEIATLDLGAYAASVDPGDSVIIRLKIHHWQAAAGAGASMRDDPTSLSLSQWMETRIPRDMMADAARSIETMELTVYPNPLSHGFNTIRLTNPESGQYTIALSDEIGRTVRPIFDGVKAAGVHYFSLPGAGLPAGTYFIHMVGEDGKVLQHTRVVVQP